jgi:two-component system sensor histidine kinase KdpD
MSALCVNMRPVSSVDHRRTLTGLCAKLADAARSREAEAESRRREADLTAEMARLLLGGTEIEESLRLVGQRIAQTFELPSVEVEPRWVDSDRRRRAAPLIVRGSRTGTLLVPAGTEPALLNTLQDRVVPALETLLTAAREREKLESQVIETKALRRSNVVKTTLLRSVSHDLRSPLTAIATAAGAPAGRSTPSTSWISARRSRRSSPRSSSTR